MPELIRVDQRVEIPEHLPVVALRDLAFFPYMVLPLLIGRPHSLAGVAAAGREGHDLLLLLAQRDPEVDEPEREDLFSVGTVARIVQTTPLSDGTTRVVLEGLGRARMESFEPEDEGSRARVAPFVPREADPPTGPDQRVLDLAGTVTSLYEEYATLNDRVAPDLGATLRDVEDCHRLLHLAAGHVLVPSVEKQPVLEAEDVAEGLERVRDLLTRELEILRIEAKLDRQIRRRMGRERRQLGIGDPGESLRPRRDEIDEWTELDRAIEDAGLPPQALERAQREMGRLKKLNPVAPEAAVIRTYLDWILALPWSRSSVDRLDVGRAAEILDAAHHGLDEVKDRVLDHIAVLSMVGELQGPILCLVGPPGVGKTSLGRSVADALGRSFVRVSLGGVRDEAEIRGHRRTYVGALPGRILQGMRRSDTANPVFLLDEVDKLARDFHGDPGAALLEVLDPEQNRAFTDHYLELDFDLSRVLFLATANTLQGIPDPLRDRMEIIRIPGYLDTEKRVIARRFIWPRQAERHGLSTDEVMLEDDAIHAIIDRYTREAGVRELERRIGRVARKLARARVESAEPTPRVGVEALRELLGPPPYLPHEREGGERRHGIANGLAWTSAGGEVLDVEVAVLPGKGEVRLTGTLGDVMKESAMAAVTYARSRAELLGLAPDFHERTDIHIHIPEGATPKDGPSAGITIAVALISALTGRATRADVALTGEITLRGRVLGVGGIKEKAVAALRSGIRRVVLPGANEPELELLPTEVREGLEFRPVDAMDDVLTAALEPPPRKSGVHAEPLGLGPT